MKYIILGLTILTTTATAQPWTDDQWITGFDSIDCDRSWDVVEAYGYDYYAQEEQAGLYEWMADDEEEDTPTIKEINECLEMIARRIDVIPQDVIWVPASRAKQLNDNFKFIKR